MPTVGNHFSGVQVTIKRIAFQKLNSDVGSNVGNDVGNNVGTVTQRRMVERYNSIKALIKSNPFISASQLSEKLAVTPRTIERDLSKMQEMGVLIREGDKNGGRWLMK